MEASSCTMPSNTHVEGSKESCNFKNNSKHIVMNNSKLIFKNTVVTTFFFNRT